MGKRVAVFGVGVVRLAVVEVGMGISRFAENGCREFSFFSGDSCPGK